MRVIPFAPGMVDTPGIRSIAAGLAPRLGFTKEQFLSLSLHRGYDGMMPAEHAAAALVYLTLRLGAGFHGQVVNGYEILERAGLLGSAVDVSSAEQAHSPAATIGERELLQQLGDFLTETEMEFNRLPIFVRPIARRGFKAKTGRGPS